jgi:ATP:ADP antiporter, AAA family
MGSPYPRTVSVPAAVRDASASPPRRTGLERWLGLFGDVRAGEGATVLLLALQAFTLLFAYYLIKTVREGLILTEVGAANKVYLSVVVSALLVVYVKAFGGLARRLGRMRLIAAVTLFFVACLGAFYALGRAGVPIAIPFFVWVGIFSVSIIAQFWSFANDVCTEAQGERVFALVAAGSTLGAVAGSYGAARFYATLGSFGLLIVAAGLLGSYLLLSWIVHRGYGRRSVEGQGPGALPPREPVGGSAGPFELVFRNRYLWLLALLTLLGTWVNTTGEFILDRTLLHAGEAAAATEEGRRAFVGQWKGTFYAWVNGVVVVLQLFVVSRLFKHLGLRVALFVLPVLVLGGYAVVWAVPTLMVIFVVKVAENGVDYSLQNTLRQALFLVTSRPAKYKAKALVDTLFYRAGDVLAAGVVALGTWLSFGTRGFVGVTVVLSAAWVGVALAVARARTQVNAARSSARVEEPSHLVGLVEHVPAAHLDEAFGEARVEEQERQQVVLEAAAAKQLGDHPGPGGAAAALAGEAGGHATDVHRRVEHERVDHPVSHAPVVP